MRRQAPFVAGCFMLTGCINVGSTNYHCAGNQELAESHSVMAYEELPGVEPGMTREQVQEIVQELRRDSSGNRLTLFLQKLVLDDTEPDLLYFKSGPCPIMRYRFNNNHLVAIGSLLMEAGIWHYSNRDYVKTRHHLIRTTTTDHKWYRFDPIYDEEGKLTGFTKTEERPTR